MTVQAMDNAALGKLRTAIRGKVLAAGDAGYDKARTLFNKMIDRKPLAIVQAASPDDVIAAVNVARTSGLELSIRGGGHGVAGTAMTNGGIAIDLSPMNKVEVDPSARIARVDAGATWADVDAATQAHGLAVTGGRISHTGVAGLTLGSGSGWLERKHGFTCDNLVSVDLVTADGRLIHASSTEHPDLFWALHGGGGNFGVVTRFAFRLHPVGPVVLAGMVLHPAEAARDLLREYRDFMAKAPDAIGGAIAFITAPPAPFVPEPARGKPVVGIIMAYFGPVEEGEKALAPLRRMGHPVLDLVQPMPYVALQKMIDEANPHGRNQYWKADMVEELSDEAIDVLVSHALKATSPFTAVLVQPLGGAVARVPDDATPVRRHASFVFHALSQWEDDDHDRHIAWTRNLADAMHRFTTGGVYLTYIGDEGEARIREAFGADKYARIVAVKDRYDPDNFFHLNQNIRPSRKPAAA